MNLQSVGVDAIEAMLRSDHFTSSYQFEFEAWSRDYSYYPNTREQVRKWFDTALVLAKSFALSDNLARVEDISILIIQKMLTTNYDASAKQALANVAFDHAAFKTILPEMKGSSGKLGQISESLACYAEGRANFGTR